jgi:glycerol kinase
MDKRLLVQAVLEGVALRMAEVVEALRRRLPLAEPLPIDGGMSANPCFAQFLADALEATLRVSDEPELTARGTAELAADALGLELDLERGGRTIEPRPLPPGARERFAAAVEAVRQYGRVGGALSAR